MSTLKVQIGAELRQLEQGLSRVSRQVSDVGKQMSDMGKTLSTRVTAPIVAFGALTVRAFGKQEDAERRLRAALQANGREVDGLFNRYNKFAQEMQRTTVIGDETTLAMLQQAESLGLTADSAERAVRNSIAMQSAFGVSAESAIRYTAALEQGNATMLTRYIPTLRDIEDETERAAEAQRVLGNAFQVAEAEAQGSRGQLIQLKNAVGDLMEVIGGVVSEAILPFVQRLKELAEQAQEVNTETLRMGVAIAGIAAAAGPALIIVGKLIVAIGALLSPIGLVVVGLATLSAAILYVWDNWQAVVERVSDWSWWRNMLVSMTQFFIDMNPFAQILNAYNKLAERFGLATVTNPFEKINEALEGLKVETKEYEHQFGSFMDAIRSGAGLARNALMGLFGGGSSNATQQVRKNIEAVTFSTQVMTRTFQAVPEQTRPAWEETRRSVISVAQASEFASQIANTFTASFGQGMANVIVQGEKLIDTLKNIGRLLASSVIQTGLSALLTGGLGGRGFFGSGGGLFGRLFNVNDALITSGGDVVKFHPDDNILAMKDFSALGGSQRVEVFGTIKGEDIFISSRRGGDTYER